MFLRNIPAYLRDGSPALEYYNRNRRVLNVDTHGGAIPSGTQSNVTQWVTTVSQHDWYILIRVAPHTSLLLIS